MPLIAKTIILDASFDPSRELTKEAYDLLPNGIFYKGYGFMEHPWFNDAVKTLVGKRYGIVKFVLYKTDYGWGCIKSLNANLELSDYLDGFDHLSASYQRIYAVGQKVYDLQSVFSLLPRLKIEDEVLDLFKH